MRPDFFPAASASCRLGQAFGGVDAGDDHIVAAVEEIIGNLGRVGGDAGDVEPEANPGDLELQVGGVFPGIFLQQYLAPR